MLLARRHLGRCQIGRKLLYLLIATQDFSRVRGISVLAQG